MCLTNWFQSQFLKSNFHPQAKKKLSKKNVIKISHFCAAFINSIHCEFASKCLDGKPSARVCVSVPLPPSSSVPPLFLSLSFCTVKEEWSLPVTSVGTLPSSLDRKIILFRENNTLVLPSALPETCLGVCVCVCVCVCALVSKSLHRCCQPEYKGSLYMISMHLWKTYWTKSPAPNSAPYQLMD